jgi:hypothetical protein
MKIQNDVSKSESERKGVYTLPVIPFLETLGKWEAEQNEDSDPLFSITVHDIQDGRRRYWPKNREYAFDVTRDFFAVNDAPKALNFFRTYGPLQTKVSTIRLSAVLRERDFFLDALLHREIGKAHDTSTIDGQEAAWRDCYFWQNLPMELKFCNPPVAIVKCRDVKESLRATVFLDRLDGLPWKRCAREKCGAPFKRGKDARKLFCSERCARLQAQHAYLDRTRKKALASGK